MSEPLAEPTVAAHDAPTRSLWHHADFLRVWASLTLSLFGSQVTYLAIPLMAVMLLQATPWQMGVLSAAGQLPFLLLSLFVGVWVDRVQRKPLLLIADYGRAVLLLLIPVAYGLGELRLELLYGVAFGVGALSVLFEVAHHAYFPVLLSRQRVMEGNSKLQVSYSAAEAAGPGLAGVLLQVMAAPLAVLIDAATFVTSGLLLGGIRAQEAAPATRDAPVGLFRAIGEGLGMLIGHRLLRPIILAGMTGGFFTGALFALYVLFVSRELGLDALTIGLIFAAGGVAAVLSAPLADRLARPLGVGPTFIAGYLLSNLALLFVPLAAGPFAAWWLTLGQVLGGATGTVANILQVSLRHIVTPSTLAGRVTASHRFLVWGAPALGALAGGAAASTFGLRTVLLVCAVGASASSFWLLFSPLRNLREQPLSEAEVR